jgi:hypothetical protein
MMNIPASDYSFSVFSGKFHTLPVKVQASNMKSRIFDCIDNVQILFKKPSEAGRSREEGMWGDYRCILPGAIPYFIQRIKIFRTGKTTPRFRA